MDHQSTAKTAKIGSLENFQPYGIYVCIELIGTESDSEGVTGVRVVLPANERKDNGSQ